MNAENISIENVEYLINHSIKHWEKNCDGPPFSIGSKDCALCNIYYPPVDENNCSGCPVSIYSGNSHCDGTPYLSVARAVHEMNYKESECGPQSKQKKDAQILARDRCAEELEFLRDVKAWFDKVKHLWYLP